MKTTTINKRLIPAQGNLAGGLSRAGESQAFFISRERRSRDDGTN